MNELITTLLDCPNLSLRLLDAKTGRSIRTVDNEQLHQMCATLQTGENSCLKHQSNALKLQNIARIIN